jgi:hypothetical protein
MKSASKQIPPVVAQPLRELPLVIVSVLHYPIFRFIGVKKNPLRSASKGTFASDPDKQWLAKQVSEWWFATPVRSGGAESTVYWGPRAERLLWAIHSQVMTTARSTVVLPDDYLSRLIWGDHRPRHWLAELRRMLLGLKRLYVMHDEHVRILPMKHAQFLQRVLHDRDEAQLDVCGDECPSRGNPRHGHFVITVRPRFLGDLNALRTETIYGDNEFDFRIDHGGDKDNPPETIRTLGQQGCLRSVYLPAKLGDLEACRQITAGQHSILQTLVHETTRERKRRKGDFNALEIITQGLVPSFNGKTKLRCPQLDPHQTYSGFNGNGKPARCGCGYHIASEGGWIFKAGYSLERIEKFLNDLKALSVPLGLIVVGVGRNAVDWFDVEQLLALATTPHGLATLKGLNLRVYTREDYLQRWNDFFKWTTPAVRAVAQATDGIANVIVKMKAMKLRPAKMAVAIGCDPSFLSKILSGKKPVPAPLLKKMHGHLNEIANAAPQRIARSQQEKPATFQMPAASASQLAHALAYRRMGWSVIPMRAGTKKPHVRWKRFKEQSVTEQNIRDWWEEWPNAGIGLLLGPVSGVLAVDVDGPEAHEALIERVGSDQRIAAPKSISGSRKPKRYHLLFQHPDMKTKARACPWHPKLELRGQGGLVVLPPSLHGSGNRYKWVKDRTPSDLSLPPLPAAIAKTLAAPVKPKAASKPLVRSLHAEKSSLHESFALSTRRFLRGDYANSDGEWNNRLFKAACDLCGRGLAIETAKQLLLKGAVPRDYDQEQIALQTIESAYSQPRLPSTI